MHGRDISSKGEPWGSARERLKDLLEPHEVKHQHTQSQQRQGFLQHQAESSLASSNTSLP